MLYMLKTSNDKLQVYEGYEGGPDKFIQSGAQLGGVLGVKTPALFSKR